MALLIGKVANISAVQLESSYSITINRQSDEMTAPRESPLFWTSNR